MDENKNNFITTINIHAHFKRLHQDSSDTLTKIEEK